MQLLVNFILSSGIIVLTILLSLLLRSKKDKLPRLLLAIIFGSFLSVIIYSFGEYNNVLWMYYLGFPVTDAIGFLMGPLLYFYLLSIFKPDELTLYRVLPHFIIFVIYISLVSIPFLISFIKDTYIFSYLKFLDKNEYIFHIQALYLLIYASGTLWQLTKFKRELKNYYANLHKKDIRWIYYLLVGIIILMVLDISSEIYFYTTESLTMYGGELITISMVVMVLWLAYFGTNQSSILLPNFIEEGASQKITTSDKIVNHHLANASKNEIKTLESRLYEVLEKQKPYQNENLTLASFADLIPTTDRKLSALLNHYLHTTFYDLINAHRVAYVKQRIMEPESQKYTLLAIAYEAGFSSKTSFNRIFKKETGVSPSVYKKEHLKV